jgi:2-amino-4-hydroxy-6-hydroxymethyldihydropteridine diphosphokinase
VNVESVNPNHTVYISVGSNQGNKLGNCRNGILNLARSAAIQLIDQSPVYRTEPVDYLEQDWFINYVVKLETKLEPLPLLDVIKSIEHAAGRIQDAIRFGPRILDLDIILYDDLVLADSRLAIPHPRMHQRRFVLKPICDIDPEIIHPVLKRTMSSLLRNLDEKGQRMTEYR